MEAKFIRKDGSKWCVFSERGKKLGCYDTREAAQQRLRQIEFFKHQEGKMEWWVTVEEMRELCPTCADKMAAKGLARINLAEIPDGVKAGDIENLAKHLAKRYGGDPHFFTKCTEAEELAGYSDEQRAGICARAHYIVTGIYPGSHRGKALESNEELAAYGSEVKALGDGRLGGYLVVFGSPEQPDLEGDYFTVTTDFGKLETSAVLYHHGLDEAVGRRVLDDGAKLRKDEVGVWIEAQLKMRDRYEQAIYELAQKGKLGWSSGTAPHLVEREQMGKAFHIVRWPLGLDASLTPMPAEPHGTQVVPIKALKAQSLSELEAADCDPPGTGSEPNRLLGAVGADDKVGGSGDLVPGHTPPRLVEGQGESSVPPAGGNSDAAESGRARGAQLSAPVAGRKAAKQAGGNGHLGVGAKCAARQSIKKVGGKAMKLDIEKIKALVPGLSEEQIAALEAVLALVMGEEPAAAEGPLADELMAKTIQKALDQLGIKPAEKAAPMRPAYTRKPDAGQAQAVEGEAENDSIKAVTQLRYGEVPTAVKAIAAELYGGRYEELRYRQHAAYAKFLRYGERALGAEERQALKTVVLTPDQILAAVLWGGEVSAIKTDLTETVDSLGGFTVPEDMRLDMIQRLPGMTVVRARADVSPTSSDVMSKIKVTGGDDRHIGAMRVTWVGDTPATNQAVTNPTFGVEKTPVHIAMCTVRVPRALIEDTAIPLAQKISEWSTEEYAIDEDEQFLIGTGIAKPQGVLPGSTNALSLTRIYSGDAATWPDANVVTKLMDLKYSVARQYRNSAVWVMNDSTAATISKVLDGTGRPIWYNSLREGEPDKLLGYPALTSEAMPDIAANAFPLFFGDLKGYQIADRVGMTLTRDELTESEADIVKFVFRRRLGGQVAQTWRFAVFQIAAA